MESSCASSSSVNLNLGQNYSSCFGKFFNCFLFSFGEFIKWNLCLSIMHRERLIKYLKQSITSTRNTQSNKLSDFDRSKNNQTKQHTMPDVMCVSVEFLFVSHNTEAITAGIQVFEGCLSSISLGGLFSKCSLSAFKKISSSL